MELILTQMNQKESNRRETTPVGTFPPNAFGWYDMHGNVWEWCEDDWHESYKGAPTDGSAWITEGGNTVVVRGGSWGYYPNYCRSAIRSIYFGRADYVNVVGFRVVWGFGRSLHCQSLQVGICRARIRRVQSIPAMLVTVSKNQLGWRAW
jgi:formylglycine-generating enzyme required for sulfatase activity